ncbi:MAG: CAP domain-containing protein, partial [Planctomycetota bacterium]
CGEALAQSDWDLYMLRLVNRARQDPTGEAGRISSSVSDSRAAVDPLAYNLIVAQAARNHNNWMHSNLGGITSSSVPDSFTHSETLDGTAGGVPATGTPNFTGASIGDRMTHVGFVWDRAGENIYTAASTSGLPINQSQMDTNHKGWWESNDHRENMLFEDFTVFGHRAESWTITPGVGNLNPAFDNLLLATQNFARPLHSPQTYIFGLLYED